MRSELPVEANGDSGVPGWQNTQLSQSRLAVVPGYSHYNFLTSLEVPQIVGKFLADPLTNPPAGAAAASQAAPAQEKNL